VPEPSCSSCFDERQLLAFCSLRRVRHEKCLVHAFQRAPHRRRIVKVRLHTFDALQRRPRTVALAADHCPKRGVDDGEAFYQSAPLFPVAPVTRIMEGILHFAIHTLTNYRDRGL
jgi:hypothetical protein